MRAILVALCLLAGGAQAGVEIVDGDTLVVDGTRYRLNGIDAPEAGQTCKTAKGRDWFCGRRATDRLFALSKGRKVRCHRISEDGYGRTIARCFVGQQDLGQAMVLAGLAWAFTKFSDEYAGAEQAARAAGRGIWQGDATPAWEEREARWTAAMLKAPAGCPIKGNINGKGERIYHAPWSRWYSRTRINEAKGERWFCSEDEAIAAGWRAPYR